MKIGDFLESIWLEIDTFAEADLLPWLKNFLGQVEHDIVTDLIPIVETAGAQVAAEIVSGQPIAAVGTTIAAIAVQAAKNAEAAGMSAGAHDLSAAITGYLATLKATGAPATAAQPATPAQAAPTA